MPSIYKRMRMGSGVIQDPIHVVPKIDKVYATLNCCWCPADFDRYRIRCLNCSNCQYCGMAIRDNSECILCGNHLPDELKIETTMKKIKVI